MSHEHGRGRIKENHLHALVTGKDFRSRVQKDRTKYTRKEKHKHQP